MARRSLNDERRVIKRLFTPEIKKFLKDWLVRRRDNPYPNREEKKEMAFKTGLTYIQICNWFANWRRKLKNSGGEPQRRSWSNLIKSYNSQANGNLEQFSISSDDSIWAEPGREANNRNEDAHGYKRRMMRRYLDGLERLDEPENKTPLLARWLESAANFRPQTRRDCSAWDVPKSSKSPSKETNSRQYNKWNVANSNQNQTNSKEDLSLSHHREEIEAAEALTRLAGLFRRGF
ncbi:homeobox protein Mohawk-like [Ctenocephalides felis]|uniref:homeobox protein Mohawk-like n=1 Tax=Ctenocephalides felis TaxID=7515 RepID=UPI000E6E3DBB|nr:homeobox protein Mohawk-like [Ctenocephalides felis]